MGDRLGIRGAVDILSQVELTSSSMMNLLIIEANIFIILELMYNEVCGGGSCSLEVCRSAVLFVVREMQAAAGK